MVHSEWEAINQDLWASEWHQLFIPEVGLSRLTWRDRLASAGDATIYNFYSSGEEVLDYRRLDERVDRSGNPVPTKSFVLAVWELLDWDKKQYKFNRVGNRAWYHQELLKGRATADASFDVSISGGLKASHTLRSLRALFPPGGKTITVEAKVAELSVSLASARIPGWLGSRYGGWGAGPAYVEEESIGLPLLSASLPIPPPYTVSIGFGLGLTWRGPLDAAQINALDWYEGRREFEPVFLFGNDELLNGTASGSRVSDLLGTGGGAFALKNHSKLLAEMIPARTVAMGREAVGKFGDDNEFNFDLSSESFHVGWPTERLSDDDTVFPNNTPRWLHGDAQNIPYFYNHPLFKKWVELGNLE
jgi:hypothetical protein